ncbi:ABC transporter permease [Saccharomonospora sp. NPDC046836]|uniref:ABC transporter permease n=1 Tax=Saccharomonospora sp. NPDC046836 TaxID=3156921 RepID=UPI0033F84E6F
MTSTRTVPPSATTAARHRAPPREQAAFASADMSVVVLPFVQFCLAAFGAFTVTSEYGSGMIRGTLASVPRRARLFAGKAVIVGGVSLLTGLILTSAMLGAVTAIVGDRPAPIAPWPSAADGVPAALASTAVLMVVGLVGFGVGALLRSAAGTLVTMTGLLFVLPVVASFLSSPWNVRVGAVLLPNLGVQLAGEANDPVLSSAGAAIALAAYLVLALGAGGYALIRRDA